MSDLAKPGESRRGFLKTTAAVVAGAGALARVAKGAPAGEAIKVGLVGCGGRGTGAAAQAIKADDYSELIAVADVDPERIDRSLEILDKRHPGKVKVEAERRYLGLDAFQKVIDSDVDVVLLATPPGFRPQHLRACIEAGKHVFCEKPVAVDAPGIRSVLETVKLAQQKQLSLVAGFCWRYHDAIKGIFERVHDGAIGDLIAYYATYYTSPVKPMPPGIDRPEGMSDVEWQIRNWYNFTWLSGDGLVEQAVHSVDKVAWAMRDEPPESCVAVGGRQIPAHGGNIFDHFELNYLYPGGVRAFVGCRQQAGCHNENSDYILGTKGRAIIGRRLAPHIEGEQEWTYDGPKVDMYQQEHDELFRSIRRGEPLNDGERMTTSTLLAIMGRMAAYTGQEITWQQALESQETLVPENIEWDGAHEVPGLAQPGITRFI